MTTAFLHDVAPPKIDPELLKIIRSTCMAKIAAELVSVQPMDPRIMADMFEAADKRSEDELRADGYEPVSRHKLLWVKK